MAKPRLRFGFREPDIDTNRPLVEGTVKVEGFELEVSRFHSPDLVDAWDASFGGLVRSKGTGKHPYVSIPAFPNRKFRLAYIFVNSAAGIERPKDLEGKRVAIYSWENTATIWARGALLNHYGVDLARVRWLVPGPLTERSAAAANAEFLPAPAQPRDEALDAMLVRGEVDAVIGPNVLPSISRRDPRVRRLFRDYKSEEQNYFRSTGIFPISHVVTLRREFVEAHPDAPVALLKAYREARDVAFARISGSDPQVVTISWASALMEEQRELMGENYWPYNVRDNVATLEAMMRFSHQLGVAPARLDYRSFFHAEAAELEGG
jgi:4,5-dihydroxyphthalate decarboxylase